MGNSRRFLGGVIVTGKRVISESSFLWSCCWRSPGSLARNHRPSPSNCPASRRWNCRKCQVTANVYDALGQPLNGLTEDNFRLSGPLSEVAAITQVENIANNDLPFGTVLVIDASESMAGAPLEQARAAARTYIENLRDIDPVAIVAFGSTVQVLQDFTTDRAALLAAIDSIDLLGRTALHQAAWEGVNLAANSPTPRRAMVLLSDGVEYGELSDVTADDVIENAFLQGVPSYTIGLGYGADRAFLERLAADTLAQFYELPTPEELQEIYTGLADRLTSQYVISVDVQAAQDGTEYPFVLTVESGGASANSMGTVRAPIPVPVVDLSGIPTEPIRTVTDLPIEVRADQDITQVVQSLDGTVVANLTAPPYTLQIDPADFPPGPLTLDVSATDVDGEIGTGSATLEIAALPPQISLSRDVSELGAINEPIEITVNAGGQTPISEVRVSLNGGEFVTLTPPFSFTLDPLALPPGDNSLDVVVRNEGGQEATYSADFIIADVPPVVSVEGLSDGQSVDAPITFQINAVGQTPVAEAEVALGGAPLTPVDGVYTIDPMTVPPGETDLSVSVTTERGQTGSASVTLLIAPLTPIVSVEGLEEGQTINGDQIITIDAVAQTPVIHGMVTVNGNDVAHPVQLPATITLPFSAMQPGENTVAISVDTAAGQNGRLSLTFVVPAVLFTPTPTNTPTPNQTATAQAVAQAAATRSAVANAASTAAAGTQIAATEGAQAGATQSAATQSAVTAQAQATATVAAQATATQGAVTAQAQAAATQSAATAVAQSQATDQASTQSARTVVAQAATRVPATVAPSATPQPATATATTARATSNAPATVQAAAAFVQQAATSARATVAVRQSATAGAQATLLSTATQAARATATQAAQAVITQAAQSTQRAVETAANATVTRQAQATAQVQTNQTATALAENISTATQQAGRTATQQAQATTSARIEASATQQANREATSAAGTQAAQTAEAQAAAQTVTAEASRAEATLGAQATRTARAELAAQTATAAVTAAPTVTTELTAEVQAADATQTPQPTFTPVEVDSQSGGGSATTGLWAVFFAIIVIAVAVVLWITRARKRRFDKP